MRPRCSESPSASAIVSEMPMLVLMVGYTMISLWILSQPIVATDNSVWSYENLQTEFFQAVHKRIAREPEQARGLALVAGGLRQRLLDQVDFQQFHVDTAGGQFEAGAAPLIR